MKKDKIYSYSEFLFEAEGGMKLSPQAYVENALRSLEQKLKKMFEFDKAEGGEVKKFGQVQKESESETSFKDLGVELQSLELSKYSKIYDNVKLKFSDEEFLYDITFIIDLKDAVAQGDEEPKIENCKIIFKKYDLDDFKLILGPKDKTAKLDEIDEDYLMKLKVEFEEEGGEEEEEFKIEYE